MQIQKFEKVKAEPFGTQFSTKLEGVNNKLVCALSATGTPCTDDQRPWPIPIPIPTEPPIFV